VKVLGQFQNIISIDPDKACYGPNDVRYADSHLAIDQLLITDSLFNASDPNIRRGYVHLVESVKEHGGKVFIFSSLHVTGEQLALYTGVAAILRFPLVIPEEEELLENLQKISVN
jgi:protein pelota